MSLPDITFFLVLVETEHDQHRTLIYIQWPRFIRDIFNKPCVMLRESLNNSRQAHTITTNVTVALDNDFAILLQLVRIAIYLLDNVRRATLRTEFLIVETFGFVKDYLYAFGQIL